MIAAVLDTNVLASGVVGFVAAADRPPALLLRLWRAGRFELVLSDHLLAELERTLVKPYFAERLTPEQVARLIRLFRRHARLTPLSITVTGVATHPEDDAVIATALSGGAAYLVTGDGPLVRRGSYQNVTFLTPRVSIELLTEGRLP